MSLTDWQLYVEDNALIAEFPEGMATDEDVFAAVNEEFERLAAKPGVDTHISVLRMDAPLNSDVFEKAQEAARAGTANDITTWITVSADIKNKALKSQVGGIPGVETATATDLDEALELAGQ